MAINTTGDVTTDASGGINVVGQTGTGALTIDGGSTLLVDANVANRDMEFQVGHELTANGTLNVTGAGSRLHFIGIDAFMRDPEFRVGDDGTASVSFTNGAELLMEDATSSGTDRVDSMPVMVWLAATPIFRRPPFCSTTHPTTPRPRSLLQSGGGERPIRISPSRTVRRQM